MAAECYSKEHCNVGEYTSTREMIDEANLLGSIRQAFEEANYGPLHTPNESRV